MKSVKIWQQIVELRIMLQGMCDGFSTELSNKKSLLTMHKKILFVLSKNKNCAPVVLIETVGIAKSNLALICKSMVSEGLITASKSDTDKRNIFYNITEKGVNELNSFYLDIATENEVNITNDKELKLMEKKFDEIIEFLNKKLKK